MSQRHHQMSDRIGVSRVHLVRSILVLLPLLPSVTHAGVIISLEATPPQWYPPVGYINGEVARVDVYAQLDANSPPTIRLRMAQFDLSDTDPLLSIEPLNFDTGTDPAIPFWDLRGAPACAANHGACGTNYFVDGNLDGENPNLLSVTYLGLTTSSQWQVVLSQSEPTLLGSLLVTMPRDDGYFDLDLLNADESNVNYGADFRSGFGSESDPIMSHWTARDATVTGGHIRFRVGFAIPEPATLTLLMLGFSLLTMNGRTNTIDRACGKAALSRSVGQRIES